MELGLSLARIIESVEAQNVAAWANESLRAGGGIACFSGPQSPISHAIGVGMSGPVSASDIDQIEEFYRTRNTASNMDLCPLADPSLMEILGRRGYRITEFNNVLARELPAAFPQQQGVRQIGRGEVEMWARTLAEGFFERTSLSTGELEIGLGIARMPEAAMFVAELHGQPLAAAAACVSNRVLYLFADSTLPSHRKLGLHSKLIEARLTWATAREASIACASTLPGSGSQRNYLRAGFAIAYTKMNMCRELAG